jgi:hypothetical protein
MTMQTPPTSVQRDNLNIGIYLAGRPHGAELDDILQAALGYNPNGPYPANSFERYERRFRNAQAVGRDHLRTRSAGYFTFNAMPFGNGYVYKITWYTWVNPQTHVCQTVPMMSLDLRRMRQVRDKDLRTREATTRSIRTAHDIEEERQAIARGDYTGLQMIQARMVEDGALGEILTGWHGLGYANIEDIIPQLPAYMTRSVIFNFQRTAATINRLNGQLHQEHARIAQQLSHWIMLQTGVPNNAPQLALQDAIRRVTMPPPPP